MSAAQTTFMVELALPAAPERSAWRPHGDRNQRFVLIEPADAPDIAAIDGAESGAGFTALIRIENDRGHMSVVMALEIDARAAPEGPTVTLRGTAYRLTLELVIEPSRTSLSWHLLSGGGDATARANNLRMLAALSGTGVLTVQDARNAAVVGRFRLDAQRWFDEELRRDLEVLSDLAVIEEWAGMHLPLPQEIPSDEVARIAQAAGIVRARAVALRVDGELIARTDVAIDQADELRLAQSLAISVFGHTVPLGVAAGSIRVRLVSSGRDPDDPDHILSVFETADEQAAQLLWTLEPPLGRLAGPWTAGATEIESDPDQAWFWRDEWQAGEASAQHELRAGQTACHPSTEAFLTYLEEHGVDRD